MEWSDWAVVILLSVSDIILFATFVLIVGKTYTQMRLNIKRCDNCNERYDLFFISIDNEKGYWNFCSSKCRSEFFTKQGMYW